MHIHIPLYCLDLPIRGKGIVLKATGKGKNMDSLRCFIPKIMKGSGTALWGTTFFTWDSRPCNYFRLCTNPGRYEFNREFLIDPRYTLID